MAAQGGSELTERRISLLVHGEAGTGKSRLAGSAPGPRLILDAEGGAAEFLPGHKVNWDPAGPLPEATTDTSVIVTVRDWGTIEQVYRVLLSGQHYFETVIWDSVTEIQEKCKKAIEAANGGSMTQNLWGSLYDKMADKIKEFRDLRLAPCPKPVHTVFVAISVNKDGRWKADVQGSLVRKLPGWVDVVGYLKVMGNPQGGLSRILAIQPLGDYDAKDRTSDPSLTERFGNAVLDPNMAQICAVLRGEM